MVKRVQVDCERAKWKGETSSTNGQFTSHWKATCNHTFKIMCHFDLGVCNVHVLCRCSTTTIYTDIFLDYLSISFLQMKWHGVIDYENELRKLISSVRIMDAYVHWRVFVIGSAFEYRRIYNFTHIHPTHCGQLHVHMSLDGVGMFVSLLLLRVPKIPNNSIAYRQHWASKCKGKKRRQHIGIVTMITINKYTSLR